MTQFTNIRQRVIDRNIQQYRNIESIYALSLHKQDMHIQQAHPGLTRDEARRQTATDLNERAIASSYAKKSKVIVFPTEQIEVFAELIEKKQVFPLDFSLPFQCVLIQFTKPYLFRFGDESFDLCAMLLAQLEETKESFEANINALRAEDARLGITDQAYKIPDWSKSDKVIHNVIVALDRDFDPFRLGWTSQEKIMQSVDPDGTIVMASPLRYALRSLAIACIGYINCENIYLHQEGGVSEAINRKRERQGKKILEPYYICRIRGVQYDSNDNPTGEGTHHGFRYDVRGHFRKLTSGKTTWVRPHQRGMQNELYIPKTYVVDKAPPSLRDTNTGAETAEAVASEAAA